MARLSHSLLGAVNVVTLLLSLPVVCIGVYFRMRAVTDCDRALQFPVIALGCAALLLSIVGLVGSCGRRSFTRPFLWAYVAAMFLLTVAAFALTVFAFVVTTNRGGGGFGGEYRLDDFSGWLQARVAQPDTWRRIESCLAEARVCGGRFEGSDVGPLAVDFYRRHLSPIQVQYTRTFFFSD
ncbi:hypothetical protein PR202_ga17208 [Eleusine coracana subsp. coracana]|uniref:Uncharacterized protein n=1 Tax=Eleusine coracana subsp. coracana TaxID=191504 RepID=A0AAV5CQC5_ELECO|nr:hypothetical protein PR202_ga17208 [Eleusine coracana subsp. coracana]